jgi:hypothetical protein
MTKCCDTCYYFKEYKTWHTWREGECRWFENKKLPYCVDIEPGAFPIISHPEKVNDCSCWIAKIVNLENSCRNHGSFGL